MVSFGALSRVLTVSMNEITNIERLPLEIIKIPRDISKDKPPLPLIFDVNNVSDAQLMHYYEYRRKSHEQLEFIHEILKEPRWKHIVNLVLDKKNSRKETECKSTDFASKSPKPCKTLKESKVGQSFVLMN